MLLRGVDGGCVCVCRGQLRVAEAKPVIGGGNAGRIVRVGAGVACRGAEACARARDGQKTHSGPYVCDAGS